MLKLFISVHDIVVCVDKTLYVRQTQLASASQRATESRGRPGQSGVGVCAQMDRDAHTNTHTLAQSLTCHMLSHLHCHQAACNPRALGEGGGGDTQTQSNNYTHTHTKVSNTLYCVYTHTHSRGFPSVPSEVQTTVVLSGHPHCSSRAQTLVARHIASRVNGAVDNIPSLIYFSKKEKKKLTLMKTLSEEKAAFSRKRERATPLTFE